MNEAERNCWANKEARKKLANDLGANFKERALKEFDEKFPYKNINGGELVYEGLGRCRYDTEIKDDIKQFISDKFDQYRDELMGCIPEKIEKQDLQIQTRESAVAYVDAERYTDGFNACIYQFKENIKKLEE